MANGDRFLQWLNSHPRKTIQDAAGVQYQTVWLWSIRKVFPTPPTAAALVLYSKGKISFDDIYRPLTKR